MDTPTVREVKIRKADVLKELDNLIQTRKEMKKAYPRKRSWRRSEVLMSMLDADRKIEALTIAKQAVQILKYEDDECKAPDDEEFWDKFGRRDATP